MTSAANRLIDFYCGTGTDHLGRRFDHLLGMDDQQLERTHDYIQWLFPTVTASRFNPEAPTLDSAAALALRSNPVARQRLHAALERMLAFYGLELDDSDPDDPGVTTTRDFPRRARTWLTPENHNYRRLTRILESLSVLGLRIYAVALFRCLHHLYRNGYGAVVGDRTLTCWRRQVE